MPAPPEEPFANEGVFTSESIRDFIAEAEEQLAGMENELLGLEQERASRPRVNEIFRHLHGLKGNTGLVLSESQQALPLDHPLLYLQKGAHGIESACEHFRQAASPPVTHEEIAFLFEALDFLKRQVGAFRENKLRPVLDARFLAHLGLSRTDFEASPAQADLLVPEVAAEVFRDVAAQTIAAAGAFLRGLEAGHPVELRSLERSVGTLLKAARYAGEPSMTALASRQLAFVDEAVRSGRPLDSAGLGILLGFQREMEELLKLLLKPPVLPEPAPPEPASPRSGADSPQPGVIRVEQRKIDDLLQMVGQLLVLKNSVADLAARLDRADLEEGLRAELRGMSEGFSRASEELREAVVTLRLFPLRSLFKRFERLIRDLSGQLGKDLRLSTRGEAVELDKSLLDQIGEPLVHLLKNAADHGVESPAERKAAGKPAHGTISIHAFRDGSTVVIEVSDDGRGLNAAAISARAVALGIIEDPASLSAAAASELIFHPGFSTAASVTKVSGRGVGMDAVRSAIGSLRGTVGVESVPGQGTTFQIRLPASLLLTKGILVECGAEEYILPIEAIRDLVRIDARQVREYRGQHLALLGERTLPVSSLQTLLGHAQAAALSSCLEEEFLFLAVIDHPVFPFGLAVDRFKGEMEAVVRPLEAQFRGFEICLGAAILGNGRVVLVLNPEEICRRAFGCSGLEATLENKLLEATAKI